MTIERSEHVDRLKTWGCGFLIALVAAGALAAAFWPRGAGAGAGGAGDDLMRRYDALQQRYDALQQRLADLDSRLEALEKR